MHAGGTMQLKDFFKVSVLALAITFLTLACASSEPEHDFELDVNDDEITVALSQAVARGVMEGLVGSDLECEDGADGEFRIFLERLDRGGSRAKASFRDGESTIDGRRRGSKLDLKIHRAGSGKIEATFPWAMAECMLGRSTSIDKSFSSVKVKVTNPDGRNFSFRMR
jgi:hypothetical protein